MSNITKHGVLILRTGNSARSQMAEGLLRHAGGDRFEVESAGTQPSAVRTEAIPAMREIGIDISRQRPHNAKESCPVYPGHTIRLHRNFEDRAAVQGSEDQRLKAFRNVRDQIRSYLTIFQE